MSSHWSLALRDLPRPDFADVHIMILPPGTVSDPVWWAEAIFNRRNSPVLVRMLMSIRQAVVPLIGLRPSPQDVFEVDEVEANEALIAVDEPHLDFRCGVRVDTDRELLIVTTTVRLHGRRGRFYFGPVSLAHGPMLRAMMRRTIQEAIDLRTQPIKAGHTRATTSAA